MILIKRNLGAKDDLGKIVTGIDLQGIECLDVDRCEDGTYMLSIKSRHDSDPSGEFARKGFTVIEGTCETCLYYGGAYTHDFIRGNIGDCYKDRGSYSPWYQCKYYTNKEEEYDKMRAETKKSDDVERLKDGVPLKRIGDLIQPGDR